MSKHSHEETNINEGFSKPTDCVWSLETSAEVMWLLDMMRCTALKSQSCSGCVSLWLHRVRFLSLPSSSNAEAAHSHERLEVKWRPLVYPPREPSHALSSTWGIWWKPFVSMPLNYQQEPLMLSSDNGSQQTTVPTNNDCIYWRWRGGANCPLSKHIWWHREAMIDLFIFFVRLSFAFKTWCLEAKMQNRPILCLAKPETFDLFYFLHVCTRLWRL